MSLECIQVSDVIPPVAEIVTTVSVVSCSRTAQTQTDGQTDRRREREKDGETATECL